MSTYVLVHGAWHGAWCWDKVVPFLEQAGHTVVTFDLPSHGQDKTPLSEVTLETYAQRTCEVVNAQTEPVILVGHSMGGLVITQAAEYCPDKVQTLVYLTAFLPQNGEGLLGLANLDSAAIIGQYFDVHPDEGYVVIKDEGIKPSFYHDCSDEDVARAKSLLNKQALAPFTTGVSTSEANFGRVPRVYIECLQDRAISPTQQKNMYTALPCKQVISMNTSHSPFLSAPQELAQNLGVL